MILGIEVALTDLRSFDPSIGRINSRGTRVNELRSELLCIGSPAESIEGIGKQQR